jgi:hypothetical protein
VPIFTFLKKKQPSERAVPRAGAGRAQQAAAAARRLGEWVGRFEGGLSAALGAYDLPSPIQKQIVMG